MGVFCGFILFSILCACKNYLRVNLGFSRRSLIILSLQINRQREARDRALIMLSLDPFSQVSSATNTTYQRTISP